MRVFFYALLSIAAALAVAGLLVRVILPSARPRTRTPLDRVLALPDVEIVYRQYGAADGSPPIIFLHGFGSDGLEWASVANQCQCGQSFALDLPGFGASGRPPVRYGLDTLATYVIDFMDALGVREAVFVGQSMGASLTAWIAGHAPERVRSVVMIAPSGFPGSLRFGWPRSRLQEPGFFHDTAVSIAQSSAFVWLFPASLARQALGVTDTYDARFERALRAIRAPTLLVWSSGDPRVPPAMSAEFMRRIPQARLHMLADAVGHDVNGNAASIVADDVRRVVQSSRRPESDVELP